MMGAARRGSRNSALHRSEGAIRTGFTCQLVQAPRVASAYLCVQGLPDVVVDVPYNRESGETSSSLMGPGRDDIECVVLQPSACGGMLRRHLSLIQHARR
ncbi:hypothetical protein, variant 3 [Aphanomyces invadans]|nr:hypothetical protein, variant 3 [Aphanomyces invadans]ETW10468.1 hypothetical protein, variant 3 [Aphanomyces invadans]|eukprot:XP_008861877.1 hypothetical protein, variant 3 [Aphanomyces invadans]